VLRMGEEGDPTPEKG
jgi:peptidylprolyl isomerase